MTFLKSLFKKREPVAPPQPPPPAPAIEETVDGFFDNPMPKAERSRAAILTRFLKPSEIHARTAREAWEAHLKKPYADIIARLLTAGELRTLTTAEGLECAKVTELKTALKTAGLRVAGNKSDLIQRLIEGAPTLAASIAAEAGANAYYVTDAGRAKAEAFITECDQREHLALDASIQYLQQQQVRQACSAINRYYAWLPEPYRPGMGIDYTGSGVIPYAGQATYILKHAADSWIIAEIPTQFQQPFILAGAASTLWPDSAGAIMEHLGISDSAEALSRPAKTYVRLLGSLGHCGAAIQEAKRLQQTLEISTCNDAYVCPTCAAYASRSYTPADAPMLPHRDCTSPDGCRCIYV
jgi:hypothetical protein